MFRMAFPMAVVAALVVFLASAVTPAVFPVLVVFLVSVAAPVVCLILAVAPKVALVVAVVALAVADFYSSNMTDISGSVPSLSTRI